MADHDHAPPPQRAKRDLAESGPVALISCIHGNLPALEAVWADIKADGIGQVLCLGDLVGYGPWPAEVIAFLRKENVPTIRGCWDEGIGENAGDCGCHFVDPANKAAGDWSYKWTQEQLGDADREWLKRLPPTLLATAGGSRLVACHGSPRSAHEYLTADTHELVLYERAGAALADVLVFGHTHVPYVKRVEGQLALSVDTTSEESGRVRPLRPKLFINAGSVGEPRHGTPEATYVVFHAATQQVEVRYVDYDVEATQAAMRRLEMPPAFAERIGRGQELAVKDKTLACDC